MNITEDTFISWSKGPSKTESEKCDNAERLVRKAIKADADISYLDISVFAQGSYRARTNVRQNSDVDICICYNSAFFPEYPKGTIKENFGNFDSNLSFYDFKDIVGKALVNYFGKSGVTRGNKAFDVHQNTYRIDADVVPTFEHRCYTGEKNSDGTHNYLSGVAFKPDKGGLIKNWPQQTYDNGVSRNHSTNRKYKRVIRILKRLRDKMQDENIVEAKNCPSFLIECLVWNADIKAYQKQTYTEILRYIIADVWNRTSNDADCSEWGEVNELKYLFRTSQPWTRKQANQFLQAAWDRIGYL